MKDDVAADIVRPATGDSPATLGAEAAEHERELRELLEFSPAAIGIVDEAGRLLFHNARLREIAASCRFGAYRS